MNKELPIKLLSDVDEFRHLINRLKESYITVSELPSQKAYFQFEGKFKSVPIVWNACVRTIEDYSVGHSVEDDPKQFIDISIENSCYKVEVGLNVKQIDHAMLQRTIIMLKNYKRLKLGRHEYGARSKTE